MSRKLSTHPRASSHSAVLPAAGRVVYAAVAFLALAGVADALYLTLLHITGQSAVCGGSATCSEVLASKYSHLGAVPVAGLGLIGYFAIFSCAVFALFGWVKSRLMLPVLVGLMFLGTLWFLYVQAFLLHQYCRFCLLSAESNVLASPQSTQ